MEFENIKSSVADHNTVKFRFSSDLILCDIVTVSQHGDDKSWERWKSAYTDICDKYGPMKSLRLNTLRPRQNGRRFADDTFKRIFLNENVRISY